MPGQDLPTLISKAKTGQLDALSALVEAMGRDLRAFIATYAVSRAMLEEVHTATWIQVRRELSQCPPNSQAITWVRQRAMAVLREQLDQERNAAISARDGVRHLIAQDGSEGLHALISPSNEGASLLNQRYSELDESLQELIARRYGDRAELSQLANDRRTSEQQIAGQLYQARAGLHWRATDGDRRPPDDPHLLLAIDRLLAGQLSPTERQALSATLMKDLGRASSFTRQARIDLMLHAVFGEYTNEQARELAGILVKIEHKRRNESSLLQVVAPPRTPVGSGTELRMANDRIAERQTGAASSVVTASGATRPVPRVGGNRRRGGSSDEALPIRDRSARSNNRTTLIIAGVFAAVGLGGLMLVWGSGGSKTTIVSNATDNTTVASVVITGSGTQVVREGGNTPASNGTRLSAGQGLDCARSETTVELAGRARVVLAAGTQVKSFDALPDHTGQIVLTKGLIQVQVSALPGVEVRTAHGRTTFGIGRGTISAESDRTLVHAQGGSVTVAGETGGVMQMPTDQRIEIAAGASPRVLKPAGFVRGINLGGTPVTIDRHRWLSHREALSAGFALGSGTSIAAPSTFSGSGLDFDRKTMLDSGLVGSGGQVQFSQVLPDGTYELTLWLANTAALDVSHLGLTVNEQQIPLGNSLLKRDTWAQLGPLSVRAAKGRIEVSLGGQGAARVCGLAIEASDGDRLALPAAVVISSPIEAATFYLGEKITLRAETVGKLKAVQFFSDDKLLGEATKEPWSLVVDTLPPADYRIIAKAVNLSGDPSVSLPLAFTVMEAFGTGTILVQQWTDLPGQKFVDINGNAKIDGPPQYSVEAKLFSTQLDWGERYYCRMRGYIHPPITGDYTFWMASDDEGELLLSTSADPTQAKRIAHSESSTGAREWTRYPTQQSKPIPLIAGQKYYIELRYKEHEGNDCGAVGWKLPNGTMDRPISGAHLSPFKP